jgi:pyruvate dehydrogenase E1 component
MKAVQQQISPWVPQRFHALGADGFGFADTRAAARRYFKIDAESVVVQALAALAEEGVIGKDAVQKAIDHYLRRVEAERQSQTMLTDQEADEARVSAPDIV